MVIEPSGKIDGSVITTLTIMLTYSAALVGIDFAAGTAAGKSPPSRTRAGGMSRPSATERRLSAADNGRKKKPQTKCDYATDTTTHNPNARARDGD